MTGEAMQSSLVLDVGVCLEIDWHVLAELVRRNLSSKSALTQNLEGREVERRLARRLVLTSSRIGE